MESERRAALILYLTAGHPSLQTSRIAADAAAGVADILEIGIPFSDPVADGLVIQASTQAALSNGTRMADCMTLASETRRESDIPIVFLTYYNPVLRLGLDRFADQAAAAGVDGVICADLPSEEADAMCACLRRTGLDLIPMLAPTSTDERLSAAGNLGSGFVYCVSRTGVTGARESLADGLAEFLERVHKLCSLPRAVGFGISTPEQARTVAALSEGVIVGSALVKLIDETPEAELPSRIEGFANKLKEELGRGD